MAEQSTRLQTWVRSQRVSPDHDGQGCPLKETDQAELPCVWRKEKSIRFEMTSSVLENKFTFIHKFPFWRDEGVIFFGGGLKFAARLAS